MGKTVGQSRRTNMMSKTKVRYGGASYVDIHYRRLWQERPAAGRAVAVTETKVDSYARSRVR